MFINGIEFSLKCTVSHFLSTKLDFHHFGSDKIADFLLYSVLWLEKKSVSKFDRFSGCNQMQGIGEILAGTVRLA